MSAIQDLRNTVARLREPGGCPWDREQTHQSLAECLVEECAELLDTIDRLDFGHMREELGDVLLQVLMHARLAEEAGHFDLEAVAAEINEKLIRRHPHVFADLKFKDSDEVLRNWDQIKATEKKASSATGPAPLFKELPPQLPALLFARDIYKQILEKGLTAPACLDEARIRSLSEGLDEEKAGALLFDLAAACRLAGVDPESALRRCAGRVVQAVENASPAPVEHS